MIVDTFTFFNDFDLLDLRLEYLYPHVDYFIICECNLSYAGKPKPMYFKENMDRYSKYLDKVRYAPYTLSTEIRYDPWFIEMQQRNHIAMCLPDLPLDAVIMISDCDEIPNIDFFPQIKKSLVEDKKIIVHMNYDLLQYNLQNKYTSSWWHPSAGKTIDVWRFGVNSYRTFLSDILVNERDFIFNAGWHLSYFLSPEKIIEKLQNTSHTEYNTEFWTDKQRIEQCIKDRKILCTEFGDSELVHVPKEAYPDHFLKVFGKFYPNY